MIDDGPAELVMLAAVARRHYLQNQSKVEIADELGISRFKVARMLEAARERGLVRIEIVRQGSLDVDASARLQERFGLAHAIVVDTADADPGAVRHQLGRAAADLLSEVLVDGDVLGLPWSRNVHAVVAALTSLPRVEVVQLTGAIALPDFDSSAVDIVRRAARLSGGQGPCLLRAVRPGHQSQCRCPAPPAGRRGRSGAGLGGDQGGRRHRGLAARGVDHPRPARRRGATRPGQPWGRSASWPGSSSTAAGKPLRPKVAARLITMDPEDLARVPEVIAVVAGATKAAAVRAALDGGLVHGLVVDATLADVLLAG